MEVNEIQGIENLFSKLKNKALPDVGDSFMSLLSSKKTGTAEPLKAVERDAGVLKESATPDKKGAAVEKKEPNKDKKERDIKEENAAPVKDKKETKEVKEAKASSETNPVCAPVAKPVEAVVADGSVAVVEAPVLTASSELLVDDGAVVPAFQSLQDISALHPISVVVDAIEVVSSQKIAAGVPTEAVVASAQPVVAPELKQASAGKLDVSALDLAVGEDVAEVVIPVGELETNVADVLRKSPEIMVQAKELAAKIGDEQKISMNVVVEEEGFSFQKPVTSIFEAQNMKKIEVDAAGEAINPILEQNSVLKPVEQPVVVNSPAAMINSAPVVVEEAPVKMAAKDAVISNVVSTGFENARVLKAETAFVEAKQNTSDVYKGMAKEVVDQVKVNITKSAIKGIDKIDVHLKPEDLGKIEIKMQIKDGKLEAHIIANRPETVEILQKEALSLEKSFQDAGFQTDSNSLSFSYRGEEGANEQSKHNRLGFMADALQEDKVNLEALALQNYDGKSGLNIKV